MKRATIKISVITPILANYAGEERRNSFSRDRDGRVVFQHTWWYTAILAAIGQTRIRGIKPGDISISPVVEVETDRYQRQYGDKGTRDHECIPARAPVTLEAVVSDHVTKSGLSTIFEHLGNFVGMSPFGHNLGYGRFNVDSIDVAEGDHPPPLPNEK